MNYDVDDDGDSESRHQEMYMLVFGLSYSLWSPVLVWFGVQLLFIVEHCLNF